MAGCGGDDGVGGGEVVGQKNLDVVYKKRIVISYEHIFNEMQESPTWKATNFAV